MRASRIIAALFAGASLAALSNGALAQATGKTSPNSAPAAATAPAPTPANTPATAVPAASAAASGPAAGNAEAGKTKLAMCIGCHGISGYKTAYPEVYHVPKIYGQQEAYIVMALQAYKTGERNHPSMRGIARGLTDADMADLAAYYGRARK